MKKEGLRTLNQIPLSPPFAKGEADLSLTMAELEAMSFLSPFDKGGFRVIFLRSSLFKVHF